MILLLHHRYRFAGGEERAVADLEWLIREHLGEDVAVLERDSRSVSTRDAALGLVSGIQFLSMGRFTRRAPSSMGYRLSAPTPTQGKGATTGRSTRHSRTTDAP